MRSRTGLAYETIEPPGSQNKPWVVFHHGIGMDGAAWGGWFAELLPHYRVLTFDVRGYGASTIDSKQLASRGLDDWVADLVSLLDEREIETAFLIGESLGGTTVLATAARHPSRIRACVACSTGFRGGLISELPKWRGIFERGGIRAWSTYMIDGRFTSADPPSILHSVDALQLRCSPEVILHDADMLSGLDLSEELRRMDTPALILAPGQSPFISREHAQDLEKLLPDARMVMFGASRHGIAWAYASECSFIATRFFGRIE